MDKDIQFKLYEKMYQIRRFEETARDVVYKGEIPGAVHLYIGEEAIAAGACAAINEDDYITSTHRGHGHALAKGAKPDRCFAELYGKKTGYCKGKGGSLHIAAPELGMLGANGIVGAGIPIATGAAMSSKKLKNGRVTLCFFGDGACNQGTFHEAVNLASAFKLPIVFIIENNLFGVSCRQSAVRNIDKLSDRAEAYGISGVTIDGNDVEKVYSTVKEAVEKARNGEGPSIIECMTYRWRGHFEGEPEVVAYRTADEVAEWKEKCPLKNYRARLAAAGITENELAEIETRVEKQISDALAFAKESEFPEVESALEDIYVG
jgi:pyruvate dehydrogenase E1 component alpha subunit